MTVKPVGEGTDQVGESRDFLDVSEIDPVIILPRKIAVTTMLPRLKYEPKILVFVETQYSVLGRDIITLLEATRRKFRVELGGKNIPILTSEDKGRFSMVIFENAEKYFRMDHWNRELLDRYCREYHVGIIGFPPVLEHTLIAASVNNLHLRLYTNLQLSNYHINASSPVLHLTKASSVLEGPLPGMWWWLMLAGNREMQTLDDAWVLACLISQSKDRKLPVIRVPRNYVFFSCLLRGIPPQ